MHDQESGNGAPGATAVDTKKIFLATTTTDLQPERDRIYRNLIERGYQVDQTIGRCGVQTGRTRTLENCDTSIHLIGSSYGLVEGGSLGHRYSKLGRRRGGRHELHRFIWMPRDQAVAESRQASFIDDFAIIP